MLDKHINGQNRGLKYPTQAVYNPDVMKPGCFQARFHSRRSYSIIRNISKISNGASSFAVRRAILKIRQSGELQSSCSVCHDWQYVIENGQIDLYRYDHTKIQKTGKECNLCHTNVVMGDGTVPIENCYQCHFERDYLNKIGDTDFVHTKHISEHKVECLQCHLTIQHKIRHVTLETGIPDCSSCHSGMHGAQLRLYTGTGGIGVPDTPNPTYEIGLNCKGCHVFPNVNGSVKGLAGDTNVARYESCEKCHGSGYNRILQNWEEVTNRRLSHVDTIVQRFSSDLENTRLSSGQKGEIDQYISNALFNIQLVESGKSVHNIDYSDELLHKAYSQIGQAADIANIEVDKLDFIDHTEVIPSECSSCHFGIEEKEMEFLSLTFKHSVHVADNKMDCGTCHSNTVTHGKLKIARERCAQCHHTTDTVECRNCHTLQYSINSGNPEFYDRNVAGVMSILSDDCLTCHEIEERVVNRPVGETCIACHEEGYDYILVDWINDAKVQLDELEIKLNEQYARTDSLENERLQEMKT